jgi:multiple sugar transport system permease protein
MTTKRLLFALLALATATFCVGPFLWQASASLAPGAYRDVFAQSPFARVLANSLAVAAFTTLLCLGTASLAAFALAKLPVRGRRAMLAFALGASMFPPIATLSPLFLVIRALGLRDQVAGLVLPYTSFALPLALWILTTHFSELPDEVYRAARVDGCTPLGAFARVLLPLAAPGLATAGMLVFIFSWNEFLYALTFTSSPTHRTVPVAIALFATGYREPWPQLGAASVIVTAPLIALTWLFQRRLVAGLTAGAVKG